MTSAAANNMRSCNMHRMVIAGITPTGMILEKYGHFLIPTASGGKALIIKWRT